MSIYFCVENASIFQMTPQVFSRTSEGTGHKSSLQGKLY